MDTFRDKAGEPIGTDIDNWVASFTRMESGSSELPPHHPNCLGCGPENPNGHFGGYMVNVRDLSITLLSATSFI